MYMIQALEVAAKRLVKCTVMPVMALKAPLTHRHLSSMARRLPGWQPPVWVFTAARGRALVCSAGRECSASELVGLQRVQVHSRVVRVVVLRVPASDTNSGEEPWVIMASTAPLRFSQVPCVRAL